MSNFAQEQMVLAQAGLAISNALGLKTGDVVITTGDITPKTQVINGQQIHDGNRDGKFTNLVININGLAYDLDPAKTEQLVSEALVKLPPITAVARVVSDDKMAVEIHDKLQALTEGTSFNQQLLKWAGFDPDVVSGDVPENDYAQSYFMTNAYGIEFGIMAHPDKEHTPEELLHNVIEPNFKERLPEIKELLIKRVEKFVSNGARSKGTSEEEITAGIAKIREEMDKLEITVNKDERGVFFSIRSPEQAKAHAENKGADPHIEPDNTDALIATNPLQFQLKETISEHKQETNPEAVSQLRKVIGRAFLYGGGEKAMAIFPMIAGRRDIQSAIQKEAKKVIAEHPQKAEAFKEIIDSPLFDKQSPFNDIDDAGVAPPRLQFIKTPDDPTLKVAIKIDKSYVHKVFEELAALGGQTWAGKITPQKPAEIAPKETNWLQNLLAGITGNSQQPQQLAYR